MVESKVCIASGRVFGRTPWPKLNINWLLIGSCMMR
jgi:hypothetical protein